MSLLVIFMYRLDHKAFGAGYGKINAGAGQPCCPSRTRPSRQPFLMGRRGLLHGQGPLASCRGLPMGQKADPG